MSLPEPISPADPVSDEEVQSVIAEFGGDAFEAIRGLLHDMTVLLAEADRSASRGFLRGQFSNGARPPVADESL